MLTNVKKKTEGFTIIEVMIVLVIAAVIILIVFLAVPALQRNSRNNQRKNDAARLTAAVAEFANNASGTLPTTYAEVGGYAGNLGFYTLPSGNLATVDTAALTNPDTIVIARSSSCTPAQGSDDAGTDRQYAVLYAVETSGAAVSQCVQG